MLRRLKDAALPFVQATNADEVLEVLGAIVNQAGVRLYGIVPQYVANREENVGEKTMFGPSVSAGLRADILTGYKRHAGPTVVRQYLNQSRPPLTLMEVMRRLKPIGEDRWLFDVIRDHGVRDALHCTHSPWVLIYNTDHVFKRSDMTDEVRKALDMAAGMAVSRVKAITAGSSPAPLAELSSREMTVLLHLGDGLSVGEIADRLVLSETSVKTFVRRATKKLNASSQLHAVALAVRSRLV